MAGSGAAGIDIRHRENGSDIETRFTLLFD
jgi:hypothetical protein